MLPALRLLRRRHLVLVASLRDGVLSEILSAPIEDHKSALTLAATHQYLASRESSHERLKGQGVLWLDTEPGELPLRLVNRYLDIKRAGRL